MQSYLPYITGPAAALVVLALGIGLIIIGKLHTDGEFKAKVTENAELKAENHDLRSALEIERATNNELARSGGVAAKALDALVEVATGRHDQHHPRQADAGLAATDLGL